MNKILFFVLFGLLFLSGNAQDFNPKTLALPENPTVEDFSFLKQELKDAQVIMLGENTHFDGNVFEIKANHIYLFLQKKSFSK